MDGGFLICKIGEERRLAHEILGHESLIDGVDFSIIWGALFWERHVGTDQDDVLHNPEAHDAPAIEHPQPLLLVEYPLLQFDRVAQCGQTLARCKDPNLKPISPLADIRGIDFSPFCIQKMVTTS